MFSSKQYLEKKTGPHGVGRLSYLQSLVTEFQDSASEEAKDQVLANLANFAYDPINYDYLRQLNVIDLFLDCLSESSELRVELAIGGLCNLALDRQNKDHILRHDGVDLVQQCLSRETEETVLSTITTLMYLVTPMSKPAITNGPTVDAMLRLAESNNPRLSNLATVFLQDYCTDVQIAEARAIQSAWDTQIQGHAAMLDGAVMAVQGSDATDIVEEPPVGTQGIETMDTHSATMPTTGP